MIHNHLHMSISGRHAWMPDLCRTPIVFGVMVVVELVVLAAVLLRLPEGATVWSQLSTASLLAQFSDLHSIGKTILMVTHSAMAASYASRVLFISDGSLFSQLYRGDEANRAFFDRIVANLSILGGGDIA